MKSINRKKLCENITAAAQLDLSQNNISGCSYAVISEGETVFKKHFGGVLPDGEKAVDDTTLFRLASMTKPVTAVAVLTLADRGALSINDPVKKYIANFRHDMTILHLLTHTSGIGDSLAEKMSAEDKRTVEGTVNFFSRASLDFAPFSKQAYSGFAAFDVVTAVVEAVSGKNYADFLRREIFEPCGMKNTGFVPTDEQWNRLVTMHSKKGGKSVAADMPKGCIFSNFPCTHHLGGAGLFSSLDDYCAFAKMLLAHGKTASGRLMSEETFSLLCTPHVPKSIMSGNERWGLGVRVITDAAYGYLPVGAFGWSGAYGSHFWIDPENRIAAVFMKNSLFDGGAGNASARRFEKAVFESLE